MSIKIVRWGTGIIPVTGDEYEGCVLISATGIERLLKLNWKVTQKQCHVFH